MCSDPSELPVLKVAGPPTATAETIPFDEFVHFVRRRCVPGAG